MEWNLINAKKKKKKSSKYYKERLLKEKGQERGTLKISREDGMEQGT